MASRTKLGVRVVMEAGLIRRYRAAAGFAAFAFLCLVGTAILREEHQSTWKNYQEVYRDTLAGRATSAVQLQSVLEYPIEIRQISVRATHVTDRCVSCHVGIEDGRMANLPLPHRLHSGNLLATHPPERFGCTACHGGIGQSLDRGESCGADQPDQLFVPFISLHTIESSCGRCHLAIFDTTSTGMPTIARGRAVFRREGCLGCHRVRGKGGSVGPDLTNEGSKNLRSFDFSHISGPRTISNWMRRHFLNPAGVSPGSTMPAFALPEEELEALTILVRGLYSPGYPPEYLTLPLVQELKGAGAPAGGTEGYALYCVACHGREGKGREFTADQFGVPHISAEDFQSVASDDYLMFTMVEGRGGRMMGSWSSRVSHLHVQEQRAIVTALRRWRPPFRLPAAIRRAGSSSSEGEELFNRLCVTCHGARGDGDLAKELNNSDFLAQASERFLLETIMRGRSNTAMPAWSRLAGRELGSLAAFLRSLQKKPVQPETGMRVRGDAARGDSLFYNLCSRCHGKFGEGDLGPAILNQDFLAAATDGFLFETISRGREHTPMFGWTSQARAGRKLITPDIDDLIAFMRTVPPPDFLPPGAGLGNPARGGQLYRELCAECHGETGEGKKAPALNNQEFLGAATNGYLLATITLGRRDTPMPSWGTGSPQHRRLSAGERKDIAAFIRSWQTVVIRSDALR
jgi:mono/diheme cytochrome c family protein